MGSRGGGCGARAQSRSSTYLRGWKWAGMGRNTVPEVKPPAPLLRSGRRAGRKSVTLPPRPSPSAVLVGAPSPQPSLLREAEGGPNVPAATPPPRLSGAWPEGRFGGVKEVGLEEEYEGV